MYGLRVQKDFNLKAEILEYEDTVRHNGFKYPKTIAEFSNCCLEIVKGFVNWMFSKELITLETISFGDKYDRDCHILYGWIYKQNWFDAIRHPRRFIVSIGENGYDAPGIRDVVYLFRR